MGPVATPSSTPIEIRLLGPVEAARDSDVVPLGGRRQRALLALLAVQVGRVVAGDRLVDELWAGEPPDGAETTLRSYVSRLRGALGDATPIRASAGGYALDAAPEQIDVVRFERLVRDGQAALSHRNPRAATQRLEAALSLVRGDPFGDVAGDGALGAEAARLEELTLHARELRNDALLQLGASGGLIDDLEGLVRAHPYRERFWWQLMLALYRADRQADALAAFHRARATLDEHLGLEPGEELRALEIAILRHEVPPATPPADRHNLPTPLTSFIGRTAELADVARLLASSRLVSLVGVGGVGKTRLAIEAATAARERFVDGAWFVDLAPLADPELVAGHVGMLLGTREQLGRTPIERLIDHLRTSEALLVLDNCEHVRDAVADVAGQVLGACPEVRILATSRIVLGVPGEVDFEVPPLGVSRAAGATALREPDAEPESDAVRLFLDRARSVRPGFIADPATLETIAGICADLDGLPLGIELAAAHARALSPREIGARLHDRFQFLVSWRRLTPARHRTLRQAMDWSYELLAADEQRLLRGGSVFAGGFTLDAVAAVTMDGDVDSSLALLERLVEASLVTVDTTLEPTRYGTLETVRQYAARHLAEAAEDDDLRRRHAAYFTECAVTYRATLDAESDVRSVAFLRRDRNNVRATLAWCRETGAWEQLLRVTGSVWRAWWFLGEVAEGRTWLELAIEHGSDAAPQALAPALLGAAGLAWAQGDLDASERHASAARMLFAALGMPGFEGSALNTLGLVASGRNDIPRARALFEAAVETMRRDPSDPARVARNVAVSIDNLGSAAKDVGDHAAAAAHYAEARALYEGIGDQEGVAMADFHLGMISAETGAMDDARRRIASALAVYRRIEFLHYAAESIEAAALVASGLHAHAEAAYLIGAANRMREQIGNPPVPILERLRDRVIAASRAELGSNATGRLIGEGQRTSSDAAIARAIAFLETGPT